MEKSAKIEFERIDVDVKPKKYLEHLSKSLVFDRYEEVPPGQLVEFTLSEDRKKFLSFVGDRPEKYVVKDGKLTVVMTACAIIYFHDNKLEVVAAL